MTLEELKEMISWHSMIIGPRNVVRLQEAAEQMLSDAKLQVRALRDMFAVHICAELGPGNFCWMCATRVEVERILRPKDQTAWDLMSQEQRDALDKGELLPANEVPFGTAPEGASNAYEYADGDRLVRVPNTNHKHGTNDTSIEESVRGKDMPPDRAADVTRCSHCGGRKGQECPECF